MVKLTKDILGNAYVDGKGNKVYVNEHFKDTNTFNVFYPNGNNNRTVNCNGVRVDNNCRILDLVSEYTPPRTLEEVAGDMAERLRREVESDGDELYDNDKVSLLKEYEALKGGAK